jgi:hypothetical protein
MRTVLAAALAGALVFTAGCSLSIDPASVPRPAAKRQAASRGGPCVAATGGHQLCGEEIGAAGRAAAPAGGHSVRGGLVADGTAAVSSSQHRIAQGAVTP